MTVTAVITQPTYLPWLGYFEQRAQADVWVGLATVQFTRRSWQVRNRLKGSNGEPYWLTVPVAACDRDTAIRDIRLAADEGAWARKHLASIEHSLGRAPWFDRVAEPLTAWLQGGHETLLGLNVSGLRWMAELLGLELNLVMASDLAPTGQKTDLLVGICRTVGADRYYSALGSKVYIEPEKFAEAGITLEYQHWQHPTYPQLHGEFVSHLAAIDCIANIGPDATRELLRPGGTRPEESTA